MGDKATLPEKNLECKKIAPEHLEEKCDLLRALGKQLVTVNGSFDLLHAGHLHILMQAKAQGDTLLVALNTDSSIQRYKSAGRPIISLPYRLQMIAALECVSHVTWFDEEDPRLLLSKIRPHVHVNGSEYGNDCIEAQTVHVHGGQLHIVQKIPGLATSEIIKTIQDLCDFSVPSKMKVKDKPLLGS